MFAAMPLEPPPDSAPAGVSSFEAADLAGMTRREQAALLGVSLRHLYRLLAAERAGSTEWAQPDPSPADASPPAGPAPSRGAEGLPYVPLVEGYRRGLHYRLDADDRSILPECPMRIGRGKGRGWQVAHRDDIKGERVAVRGSCPHRFRPRRPRKSRDRVA